MEPITAWMLIPFLLMLIGIAAAPLVASRCWERDKNKIIFSLALAVPTILYLLASGYSTEVVHQLLYDYVPFIILVSTLFVVTGGINIELNLRPTPAANTLMLAIGYLLASVMGTTGAALLLVRPLLGMNKNRIYKTHLMLYLIALVANCGGLLTPLGDPPLFMLFLRGVPFAWFSGLYPVWLFVGGVLLLLYFLFDRYMYRRELVENALINERADGDFLRCGGALNFLFLIAVVLAVAFVNNEYIPSMGDEDAPLYIKLLREIVLVAIAVSSWLFTSCKVREANHFSWAPLNEVVILFFGVFATMTPALLFLKANAGSIGIESVDGFYYATGCLSSFLDNTPTAVTFHTLAIEFSSGYTNIVGGVYEGYLAAVSLGAVLFGSMTYIGNGPNFMVKAIAEKDGVSMPGFVGYMVHFSLPILLPLFILVGLFFLS